MVKTLLAWLLLSMPLWARSYSTSFPLTANPISENSNWTVPSQHGDSALWSDVQTSTNLAYGQTMPTTYGDPSANLTGTWGANQDARGVVVSSGGLSGAHEVELRLRETIGSSSITGYEFQMSLVSGTPYAQIVRWNGANGHFCTLVSNTTSYAVTGDILYATATGSNPTTLTFYYNGTRILQYADSGSGPGACGADANFGPWTSGAPGIGFFDGGADWSAFGFSSFWATDHLDWQENGRAYGSNKNGRDYTYISSGRAYGPRNGTWSLAHFTYCDSAGTCAGGGSCTTSSCTPTIPSTTAGNLVILSMGTASNGAILSSPVVGSQSLTQCTGCSVTNTNLSMAGAYTLSAAGAQTSAHCAPSVTSTFLACTVYEYHWTGASASYDIAGTANDASCSSCAAAALTTAGKDTCIQSAIPNNSFTAISGTWTNPANFSDGFGCAGYINTTTGALTTPTWTQSPAGTMVGFGACFEGN